VDRLGAKKCMLVALVLATPTVVAFTLSRSFDQALVVCISLVVSNAFLRIASNVLLADTIPRSSRGRVMATLGQGIGVGISGGGYAQGFLLFIPATIGSFVGRYIYESSPSLPWLIQAAVLALGMALVFAFVREPGRREA
jgi:MFS family permease